VKKESELENKKQLELELRKKREKEGVEALPKLPSWLSFKGGASHWLSDFERQRAQLGQKCHLFSCARLSTIGAAFKKF
jgi:hypothetical protein